MNTTTEVRTEEAETFDALIGHLMDLGGMRVSVSTDAIVVSDVRVQGTDLTERKGQRWADVRLGENVRLLFCEQGMHSCAWVTDDAAPERECFAVLDRGGERELMILLEPGRPQP